MLSSVDLERLIMVKRREIDQEKTLLGLTSVTNRNNAKSSDAVEEKKVKFRSRAFSENDVLSSDNNTNEKSPVDDQDTISPDLERYIRRYLGLPVMLKAGEYSPNNPLIRAERTTGDVLLGLGEYERRRNTLRKIRQKQYREYLDQQAKKKQEAKEQAERERREREEKERLEEERERQRLELERVRSPERRRSHSYSSYTTGADNTYTAKVDSAVQVDHRDTPLSVAVQTDDADSYVPTQRRNLLTQAERELSPHTVVEGKDNRSIQPGSWLRNPARTEYRDEDRTGHRPDQTAKRDGNRTGDWRPDRDEIRTRDWRPIKINDPDDNADWRPKQTEDEDLLRTVNWSNQTGYRDENCPGEKQDDSHKNEKNSDWGPDETAYRDEHLDGNCRPDRIREPGRHLINKMQDGISQKNERGTKDWDLVETSDQIRSGIREIQVGMRYRDEKRPGYFRSDETEMKDIHRPGYKPPDMGERDRRFNGREQRIEKQQDEKRSRDWGPDETANRDEHLDGNWRPDRIREPGRHLINEIQDGISQKNERGTKHWDFEESNRIRRGLREIQDEISQNNERGTKDWDRDDTSDRFRRGIREIQDEMRQKNERGTKDWDLVETSDQIRSGIREIQDGMKYRDEKRPGYCRSDKTEMKDGHRPGYKPPDMGERDRRFSEKEQRIEKQHDEKRSRDWGPDETANRDEHMNENRRPDRISEREVHRPGQNVGEKGNDWPLWKDSQGSDCRWDEQKHERRRSYGDYERTWSQARRSPGPRYMPSILDAEAIQRRNQLAEQEAAERRQFYQQELRNQIREQQRIREERKTREKMLEQAEMRRLEQQLKTLQLAQQREDARAREVTAAMTDNAKEYERKRTTLQKEIDLEQRILRNPLRNVQTSKSDVPHGTKSYYPQYEGRRQTYSTNIPDSSLFSPNYDVESYLRKNLNPTKESLISNKMITDDTQETDAKLKCESSLPIPVLRHSPVNEDMNLVKSYADGEELSDAMQKVDDKWKVPIVQKNILKCMQSEDGKNVSILTQLGSIRRQLQMEQLKLDKMLSKNSEV